MNDVFRVAAAGGTPMAVTADRYVNEFGAAASPDGQRLAVVARGNCVGAMVAEGQQPPRSIRDLDHRMSTATPAYRQIRRAARAQVWPMWSGDGRSLFYVSDRGGAENIWTRPAAAAGADVQITKFTDGRVLWPTTTLDGRTIAFERDFGIWTLDTTSGEAHAVPITRRGAPAAPAPERLRQTSSFSDLALSPDGRKVAFVARGDVFAASAKDAGDATRVTDTPEPGVAAGVGARQPAPGVTSPPRRPASRFVCTTSPRTRRQRSRPAA